MTISYFNSLPAKGMPHVASGEMDINEFLTAIKYGKWKDLVEPIRNEPDKAVRDSLKRALVSVTVSGTFNERKEDKIIQHSGFIAIDIDGNNQKQLLYNDPYVYACFLSVSGLGFVPVFKIDETKHKESFRWIEAYLFNTYGLVCDPAPQNVASLRYVTFDPQIYINEKAKKAKFLVRDSKPKTLPILIPEDQLSTLVSEAVNRGLSLCESYQEYRDIAFAIASGCGESGRHYFHALAGMSAKYDTRHADRQYDIALADRGGKKITIGTLYHYLKQSGIEIVPSNSNRQALTTTLLAKRQNKAKEVVSRQLSELHNIPEIQAAKLVDEVYERNDLNVVSLSKDPEHLIQNICEFIGSNYNLKKNSITGIVENNGIEFTKENYNSLWLKVRSIFNSASVTFELIDRLTHSDFIPEYNPIADWISKNEHRHSKGNIDKLIASIITDTPNAGIYIRKWLIGVAASYNGHPVRYVLSLVGGQYTGKTEFFRRLLPRGLSKYYAESKLDAGKDDEILMCQKLIVMDDEMGGKSKQDAKRFKELTSKAVFSLRAPYGRNNEDFKRLAILCGTSNDPQIINDPTGNTRILPINIISINHELYNAINKDDLFMEIVDIFNSGESWELDQSQLTDLGTCSDDFEIAPMERELLVKFFKIPEREIDCEFLTATEIKDLIESRTNQKINSVSKFGIELRKYFGTPTKRRKNGIPISCYRVEVIGSEKIPSLAAQEDDLPF